MMVEGTLCEEEERRRREGGRGGEGGRGRRGGTGGEGGREGGGGGEEEEKERELGSSQLKNWLVYVYTLAGNSGGHRDNHCLD